MLGGTELLSQTRSGTTSYYLHDGQGSVRGLTNTSGTFTDRYSYDAFGNLTNLSGTTTNSYLYTGQQFDSNTGLYSLRARYYAPNLGRFLGRDTAGYILGSPAEINRYVYTHNNPVNYTDPTGYQDIGELTLEYKTISVNKEVVEALALVGAATACTYIYVESVILAENHDGIALRQMEKWLPSPNTCHIPIYLYPGYATPTIGRHIDAAQNAGYPMLLNYIGPNLNDFNRRQVCTKKVKESLSPLSCDEYPFASTIQGGTGASVTGVPDWEQDIQGGYNLKFYSTKLPIPFLPLAPFAVVVDWSGDP